MSVRAYRLPPTGMDDCSIAGCGQLATHGIPTRDRLEVMPFCERHVGPVLAAYPNGPEYDPLGLEEPQVIQ